MLKITPATGHRFNVTYRGEPIMLKDLKLRDEAISEIDDMLHSLRDQPCDSKIAFLTYEAGKVTFFKHLAGRNVPVYLTGLPTELMVRIRQIEAAVLPLVVTSGNT